MALQHQLKGKQKFAEIWETERGGAVGCLISLSKQGELRQEKGVWFVDHDLAQEVKPVESGALPDILGTFPGCGWIWACLFHHFFQGCSQEFPSAKSALKAGSVVV